MPKRLYIVFLALPILCVAAASHAAGADLDAGRDLLETDRWTEARDVFQALTQREPDNAEAYYQLGRVYIGMSDYEAAVEALERAVALDPRHVQAHLRMGSVYEFQGRLDQALDAYGAVVQWARPDTDEAREAVKKLSYVTATKHAKAGEIDTALPMFQRLADQYPEDLLVRYSLGVAYMVKGRMADAQATFKKVLELDPDYINAHLNLAAVYERQGQIASAAQSLQRVVDIEPDSAAGRKAKVRLNLIEARLLADGGNLPAALSAYQQALDIDPDNRVALYGSAELHRRLRDSAGELLAYQRIVEVIPQDMPARVRLAELYLAEGRYLEAYDHLETVVQSGERSRAEIRARDLLARLRATDEGKRIEQEKILARIKELRAHLEERPEDLAALRELAVLSFRQRMYREARAAFEKILQMNFEDLQSHRALSAIYDQLGMFAEAVREYNWLLARVEDPQAAESLAEALKLANAKRLYVEGRLELAADQFTEIVSRDPDNAVAHFYLGLIYTREEETVKAVDAYQEVMRLLPAHAGARLNLALSYERLNREEDAIDEYRKILQADPPPEVAETAKARLDSARKRIRGVSTSMSYLMAYDSNSNLSARLPVDDYRSDLTLNLAYQYKTEGGVRWRFAAAPEYSNYHEGQFDFLNTSATVSATLMPRRYTVVGGYRHRTSDGLLTTSRLSRSDTLFGEALTRVRLPNLLAWDRDDGVFSEISANVSYTDFDSRASEFFSSYSTAAGVSLVQPVTDRHQMRLGYTFVNNENKELVGSDYAYRSHGVNLGVDRRMPWGSTNLNYGFTFYNYTNLDSFSGFTEKRRNTRHNLALGATYRFRPRFNFFATLSWTRNHSNLPVGFILSTEDVIEGQQSSSLSDFTRTMLTTGINVAF